jgi:CheY-like chemotaxis protein
MPLKIFIADDDVDDLELIEDALLQQAPGILLETVRSGRAAIDRLDAYAPDTIPDLIILDYSMPEINGAAVLAHLSKMDKYKNTPRVIMSTSDASLHMNECRNNGAIAYFVKPITHQELQIIASRLLELAAHN